MPYIAGYSSGLVVSQWLAALGDLVHSGDPLVELDGESAILEVTATATGVLVACHAVEGQVVQAGDIVGILQLDADLAEAPRPPPPSSPLPLPPPPSPAASSATEPTWEIRVFDLPLGPTAVILDAGWEPFAVVGAGQVVARRRR